MAMAEGNALGKGPVIFHLFDSGIDYIRSQAASELSSIHCLKSWSLHVLPCASVHLCVVSACLPHFCLSVRPSVRPSVHRFVCLSVCLVMTAS